MDGDDAALVQSTCNDPNSILHPTARQHISRHVKHLAKHKNISSALNTSTEKLLDTQERWQRLTAESETVTVPVTPQAPAPVNSPGVCPPQDAPLPQVAVERMVKEISS